ncbi:hypothetical protein [Natronorarus salvus]|uniref:hypothetical protein n=1 Tax=Natronorarus salvus TaxID=3117733 RepID=UPI002F25F742
MPGGARDRPDRLYVRRFGVADRDRDTTTAGVGMTVRESASDGEPWRLFVSARWE